MDTSPNLPLFTPQNLDDIRDQCLAPKCVRNPTLMDLVHLMDNINTESDCPIQPSTLDQPINLSNFPLVITGTVQHPLSGELTHAGWLVQIYGCINATPFKGPHVVKLLANLSPEFPSPLPIQIPVLVSSLSSFRKYACKTIDHLSFDRATFMYIPQTKQIFRLWTMRCLIDLPRVFPPLCALHHFIPAAPTYALNQISKGIIEPQKFEGLPDPANSVYSLLHSSLERSLLTCLNSYFRITNNLDLSVHVLITHILETIQLLTVLQKKTGRGERAERLHQIWIDTQNQFYPPTTLTLDTDLLLFINEEDILG